MVVTKDKSEYAPVDPDFRPLPKYGHLSEVDPIFAESKSQMDAFADSLWDPSSSVEEFRKAWSFPQAAPPGCPKEGEDVVTETRKIPMRDGAEVEIKVFKAKDKKPGSALVMRYHGGGWVVGGHATESAEHLMIAGKTNSVVVSVDYRMAPEFKFPYAVNDCFDALKWSKENAASLGADPNKIIVSGSSAGGNLASVIAIMARDEGVTGIVGQVLAYPVTVHPKFAPKDKYEFGSWQQNHNASMVTALRLEWFFDLYMPEPSPDWRFSPLLAPSLKNLPPALILVAGYDPLRDDGTAYAERLKEEGVDVDVRAYQGMPHCFNGGLVGHPKVDDYYSRLEAFVKKFAG